MTVYWSAVRLLHCGFPNSGKVFTAGKYFHEIDDELHLTLQLMCSRENVPSSCAITHHDILLHSRQVELIGLCLIHRTRKTSLQLLIIFKESANFFQWRVYHDQIRISYLNCEAWMLCQLNNSIQRIQGQNRRKLFKAARSSAVPIEELNQNSEIIQWHFAII